MDIAILNLIPHGRLGDRFLNIIGFYIICKYLNLKPNITSFYTHIENMNWDYYDKNLFNFSNEFILNNTNNIKYCFSIPYSPIKVYNFLINNNINVSFEQISKDFIYYGKMIIKPSQIISNKIPKNLNEVYGIHLRKSDRVNNGDDSRLSTLENELPIIIDNLLKDVITIINTEINPKFLIMSEDNDWKIYISQKILNYANENNKKIELIKLDYTNENNYINYESILDFFCLSKCKEILMGVKSTSFSYAAGILGNNKIRNYCNNFHNYENLYFNAFSSVIRINNNDFNYDVKYHTKITDWVDNVNVYLLK